MKDHKKIYTNIIIVLLGPAFSLCAIMAGKNFKFNSSHLIIVGVGTTIALVVSCIVHSSIRNNLKKANIVSVITSEFIYFMFVIVSSLAPEERMWLPVILLFLPIFSLPTAISVSIGVGGIMKRVKK